MQPACPARVTTLRNGARIERAAAGGETPGRTVAILTREIALGVRFRDHRDAVAVFSYPEMPSGSDAAGASPRTLDEDVSLELELVPEGSGAFTLVLTARRSA